MLGWSGRCANHMSPLPIRWRTDNLWGLGKERMRLLGQSPSPEYSGGPLRSQSLRSPLRAIYYCKYDLLQVRSKNKKVVTVGTILVAVSCELGFRMRMYPPPVAYPSGAG